MLGFFFISMIGSRLKPAFFRSRHHKKGFFSKQSRSSDWSDFKFMTNRGWIYVNIIQLFFSVQERKKIWLKITLGNSKLILCMHLSCLQLCFHMSEPTHTYREMLINSCLSFSTGRKLIFRFFMFRTRIAPIWIWLSSLIHVQGKQTFLDRLMEIWLWLGRWKKQSLYYNYFDVFSNKIIF